MGSKRGGTRWAPSSVPFPTPPTLNDLLFSGDKGVWRGTWQATQRKEWEGIPATGRKAKWTVVIIGRFAGDKLAEDWVEYDRYNLFRQLGGR
jgi:predicted ester cyclase